MPPLGDMMVKASTFPFQLISVPCKTNTQPSTVFHDLNLSPSEPQAETENVSKPNNSIKTDIEKVEVLQTRLLENYCDARWTVRT